MHLRTSKCGAPQAKNSSDEMPSTYFPYFCTFGSQNQYMLQISKNILVLLVTPVVFLLINACGGSSQEQETFRNWCIKKTDSIWVILNNTRKEFAYPMDEIEERKVEMDSFLRILKFTTPPGISSELMSKITQYHSVFAVYKPIAAEYKNTVLKSEDLFYQIKALERSVKNGDFDSKQMEFKKTWTELKEEVDENNQEAHKVASKLSSVEPLYRRLQPKIELLVSELNK
jgi:hypothetical protein